MKTKIFTPFCLLILFQAIYIKAQVLNVQEVFQEQTQWCWAGVSSCTLEYYGVPTEQCVIAEYTRTVATWHNFGPVDCCVNPSLGCNYWNYNWGYPGSIQDILIHFGSIQNDGVSSYLDQPTVIGEISANRPFIIRWGWTSGGGHFLVGHGMAGNDLYYMNPWYGEGLKIAEYSWVVSSSDHDWTHTNQLITSSARPYPAGDITGPETLVKGQQDVSYSISPITNATSYLWTISPAGAGTITSTSANAQLDLNPTFLGTFTLTVKGHNSIGDGGTSNPLYINVIPGVGIGDQSLASQVKLYPNPSKGRIFITLPGGQPQADIEISNTSGIIQLVQPVPESGEIDLSHLPRGLYLVKIKNRNFSGIYKLTLID